MTKAEVNRELKKFAPAQRKILITLQDQIAAALPTSSQAIKYGIPTFICEGVAVVGFNGYMAHNSLFPYSGSFSPRLQSELKDFLQTKGSIHFDLDAEFPKSLLKKILKERIKQINESYPKKNGEFLEFYENGVLKAKGRYKAGKLHGDWVWYRKTGVAMRSGAFKNGNQVGTWITYDARGKVYKTTEF